MHERNLKNAPLCFVFLYTCAFYEFREYANNIDAKSRDSNPILNIYKSAEYNHNIMFIFCMNPF